MTLAVLCMAPAGARPADPATPEAVWLASQLAPTYEPADSYVLTLSSTRRTDASSTGPGGRHRNEQSRLHYAATVIVLETDEHGRPTLERHQAVDFRRAEGERASALFRDEAAFDVERRADGRLRVTVGDRRVNRGTEKKLERILAEQFEYSLGPALFDPGEPVVPGESWILDESLTRRFLRARGVRVVELAEPPTAALVRYGMPDGESQLVLHYRIPVSWFRLGDMPLNASTADSDARFEGRILLPPEPGAGPIEHEFELEMRMNGIVRAPGVARSFPWKLHSSLVADQQTLPVDGPYALLPASPASR